MDVAPVPGCGSGGHVCKGIGGSVADPSAKGSGGTGVADARKVITAGSGQQLP